MLRAWGHQDGGGEQNLAVYVVLNTDNALHSEMVSVPPSLPSRRVWFSSKSQKFTSWKKEVPALKLA